MPETSARPPRLLCRERYGDGPHAGRVGTGLNLAAPPYMAAPMTDTPPDHLSIDPSSPFFAAEALQRGVGIKFKGRQRHDVEEYSISEGWIRVQAGKTVDRRGKPLTIKLNGDVEAWFENPADGEAADASA